MPIKYQDYLQKDANGTGFSAEEKRFISEFSEKLYSLSFPMIHGAQGDLEAINPNPRIYGAGLLIENATIQTNSIGASNIDEGSWDEIVGDIDRMGETFEEDGVLDHVIEEGTKAHGEIFEDDLFRYFRLVNSTLEMSMDVEGLYSQRHPNPELEPNTYGLVGEERDFMRDFSQKLTNVGERLAQVDSQNTLLASNALSTQSLVAANLSRTAEQIRRADTENDRSLQNDLAGSLDNYFTSPEVMKNIIAEGTKGDAPEFGKNGEEFIKFVEIQGKAFGIQRDMEQVRSTVDQAVKAAEEDRVREQEEQQRQREEQERQHRELEERRSQAQVDAANAAKALADSVRAAENERLTREFNERQQQIEREKADIQRQINELDEEISGYENARSVPKAGGEIIKEEPEKIDNIINIEPEQEINNIIGDDLPLDNSFIEQPKEEVKEQPKEEIKEQPKKAAKAPKQPPFERELERVKEREQKMAATFGKDAKLEGSKDDLSKFDSDAADKFNSIQLKEPAGVKNHAEDIVMLTSIGATLNAEDNQLDRVISSSSNFDDTQLSFNQTYILENIPANDQRKRPYSDIMLNSRQKAANALNGFDKDPTAAVKYVKTAVQVTKDGFISTLSTRDIQDPKKELYGYITNLMDDPELDQKFGITAMLNEKEQTKIRSNAVMINAHKQFAENADKLTKENAADRSAVVKNTILNACLMNAVSVKDDFTKAIDEKLEGIADKYAKYENVSSGKKLMSEFRKKAIKGGQRTKFHKLGYGFGAELAKKGYEFELFTADQAIIGTKGGVEELSAKLSEQIENSDLYKKMMEAKTPEEMQNHLEELKDKRFTDFGVAVDPARKNALMSETPKIDAITKDFEDTLEKEFCKDMTLQAIEEAEAELSSWRIGHSNSKEYNTLRTSLTELKAVVQAAPDGPTLAANMDFKNKLLTAYQASVDYQDKNRDKHGIAYDDYDTIPDSKLGGPRFRGARIIEKFAEKHFVTEDVAQKKALRDEKEAVLRESATSIRNIMSNPAYRNMTALDQKEAIRLHVVKMFTATAMEKANSELNEVGDPRYNAEQFRDDLNDSVAGIAQREDVDAMFRDPSISAQKIADAALNKHGRGLSEIMRKSFAKIKNNAANRGPREAERNRSNDGPNFNK